MARKFVRKKKNSILTLRQQIEENHKLIASLGVFIALSLFSSNLELKTLGTSLSFIFLSLAFLVWIELINAFITGLETRKSLTLVLAEMLIMPSLPLFIIYWLTISLKVWSGFVESVLTLVLLRVMVKLFPKVIEKLIDKLRLRIGKAKPFTQKLVGSTLYFGIAIFITAIASALAFLLARPIRAWLTQWAGK